VTSLHGENALYEMSMGSTSASTCLILAKFPSRSGLSSPIGRISDCEPDPWAHLSPEALWSGPDFSPDPHCGKDRHIPGSGRSLGLSAHPVWIPGKPVATLHSRHCTSFLVGAGAGSALGSGWSAIAGALQASTGGQQAEATDLWDPFLWIFLYKK
jgi:hypothetical protein